MDPPVPGKQDLSASRYDVKSVDIASGSTHADVVLLTGEGTTVLELGPATGYMTRAFKQRGCHVVGIELDATMAERAAEYLDRVVVADLDTMDLEVHLGEERFDVIVAADVLEHLADPLSVLRRLEPFLAPDGAFVISVPNVAHGSVRLALLSGRFDYQEVGLLDRTHVTFFTRQTLESMLDEAELGIAVLHRHELNLDASEVPFDEEVVPEDLRHRLETDLDSRTYQFVVKAVPMGRDGLRELQHRLRGQAVGLADAQRELDDLRPGFDLARREAEEAGAALAKIAAREGEMRRSLVAVHDQLMSREATLDELGTDLQVALGDLERERELRAGDRRWNAELTGALDMQERSVNELRRELQALSWRGLFVSALRRVARLIGRARE